MKKFKNHPVALTLAIYLILTGPQVLFGLVAGLVSLSKNSPLDQIFTRLSENLELISLYLTLISLSLAYIFARKVLNKSKADLGLMAHKKSYIRGIILGFLALTFIVLSLGALGYLDLSIKSIRPLVFLAYLVGWIIQSFEEEFLFRSILMTELENDKSKRRAIVSNSLIFSIFHLGNNGFSPLAFLNIFLLGFILSLLFYKSRGVFMPAGFHFIWNMAQANIYGIAVSGLRPIEDSILSANLTGQGIISGGDFGIEASIITSLVLVGALIVLMRKDRP